jgi:hypothetical protein
LLGGGTRWSPGDARGTWGARGFAWGGRLRWAPEGGLCWFGELPQRTCCGGCGCKENVGELEWEFVEFRRVSEGFTIG